MLGAKYFYANGQLRQVLCGQRHHVCVRVGKILLAERYCLKGDDQSILIFQDSAGSVIAQSTVRSCEALTYAPYGNFEGETVHKSLLRYNGERLDSLINGYFLGNGARFFSVVRPGFLSYDSLSPFGSGGINGYSYCGGDPINHTDPTGKTRMRTGTARPLKRTWRETKSRLDQSNPTELLTLVKKSPEYLLHIEGAEATNVLNHVLALSRDPLSPVPKGLFSASNEFFNDVRERRLNVNLKIEAFSQAPSPGAAAEIVQQLYIIRNQIKFERDRAHVRLRSVAKRLIAPALDDISSWRRQ